MTRLVLLSFALLFTAPHVASGKDGSEKIKKLREEKVLLLKEMLEYTTTKYQAGQAKLMEVLEAKMKHLDAGLDLADTHEKRLAQLVQLVRTAEEMVKTAEDLVKANEGTVNDVRRAKLFLIERKIALEKEN